MMILKNNMPKNKLFATLAFMKYGIFSFIALMLTGCQIPVAHHTAHTQAYVSAQPQDSQYVSALLEAQKDAENKPTQPIWPTVEPTTKILSVDIWGVPPGGDGTGVSLKEPYMRARLNDALNTTPLGGRAQWQNADLTYLFLPNSPVYTAHQTGGRCRDGVLAIYGDGFNDQRIRGLFCQTGPAADWLLLQ